jgi:Xaa-Pro aminopeptidase
MKGKQAILLVGSSKNTNLLWATKFDVPDPVTFIQIDNKKILLTSGLETKRAKKQAQVDQVINISDYKEKAGLENFSIYEIIALILKDLGVDKVVVSESFPYELGKILENENLSVRVKNEPFFEQRTIKTKQEIGYITKVQRAVEDVLQETLEIIRKSKIKKTIRGDFLYYQAEILTSENLRKFMNIELLKRDCFSEAGLIISSGEQTSMPHLLGSGPLKANTPIIFDIFPRSITTKYWADMTRTAVKGEASSEFKELYNTVLEGQKRAISMVKPGIDGFDIDKMIRNFFVSKGYKTDKSKSQGFFHGTGHGVGLDIHEFPKIRQEKGQVLKPGNVFTIEPGLYYEDIGGIRIEDLVVVTENGCVNLTRFPKRLMEL